MADRHRGLRRQGPWLAPRFPRDALPTCFHELALLTKDVGEGDWACGRTGGCQRGFHGSPGVSGVGHVAASRPFRVSEQRTSLAQEPSV